MKWILVVVILGTTPVKTDLVFDNLRECLMAEEDMREEYVNAFNEWLAWAQENPEESGYPSSQEFMMNRIGLRHLGTCIPAEASEKP